MNLLKINFPNLSEMGQLAKLHDNHTLSQTAIGKRRIHTGLERDIGRISVRRSDYCKNTNYFIYSS